MQIIYELIQENPKYFAWIFGVINALWGLFMYFNKQSHDKEIVKLKHYLLLQREEVLPIIKMLQDIEILAGEAKEIVTSYKDANYKKELFMPIYEKLGTLTGQCSKFPSLMKSLRDLNHYSSIMVQGDPHESCRDDVLNLYKVLLNETEIVRKRLK